ncbi:MAG: CvpA family protein [Opitutales bacterium]|nr:CvpA family protein [Opitutales bacterium]
MAPSFDITDWQLFIYIILAVLLIFSAWQGWQHGLGRSAIILAGVGIGLFAGQTLGFLIKDVYQSIIPYPAPLLKLITNAIFALLVYFLFVAGAMFMFKSTRKQPTLQKKIISGVGGTIFGVANGLVVVSALVITIRLTGISNLNIPPQPGTLEHRQQQEVYLPEHFEQNERFVIQVYRAILNPPLGKWSRMLDPIPESNYELLIHSKIMTERSDLRQQFIESEAVQQLLTTPEIASTLEESLIPQMLERGEFHAIIKSPEIRQIYSNSEKAAVVKNVNWLEIMSEIVQQSDLTNHPDL